VRLYARTTHRLDVVAMRRPQHSPHCDAYVPQRPSFHDSFSDVLWEGACLEKKGTFGSGSTGGGFTQSMVRASHSTTANADASVGQPLLSYRRVLGAVCVSLATCTQSELSATE
jgi:hypothetical protein